MHYVMYRSILSFIFKCVLWNSGGNFSQRITWDLAWVSHWNSEIKSPFKQSQYVNFSEQIYAHKDKHLLLLFDYLEKDTTIFDILDTSLLSNLIDSEAIETQCPNTLDSIVSHWKTMQPFKIHTMLRQKHSPLYMKFHLHF